ncbi:MAG: hypothetical protein PHW31_04495 [Candidatus Pacebacteria bacterium]|nr:hypothetical protein [Candidatus Paceibacterota bacterium]
MRRVIEGTISFDPTMLVLQEIIEGKHEPKARKLDVPMQRCEVFSGSKCSICGAYFGDSADDIVCNNGHLIGHYYPVRQAS